MDQILVRIYVGVTQIELVVNKLATLKNLMTELHIDTNTNIIFACTSEDDNDEPLDLIQTLESLINSESIVNLTVIPILDVSQYNFELYTPNYEMLHST
jgi:hypothetical protein